MTPSVFFAQALKDTSPSKRFALRGRRACAKAHE